MRTIVIDPGHGGADSGACTSGVKEKDIVLAYSKMLSHFLRAAGLRSRFTREDDRTFSVAFRQKIIQPGEILVSCHTNASRSASANGLEVWYRGGVKESKQLARHVFDSIYKLKFFRSRGVLSDMTRYRIGFYMLRNAVIRGCRECILVEPGFLTNPDDRAILTHERNRNLIARAISEGIISYLNESR